MTSALLRAAAVVLVAGVLSGRAHADPLLVTAGGFSYGGDPFGWSLAGEDFTLGGGGTGIPIRSPFSICGLCPPGTTISLSSVLDGSGRPGALGYGFATISGSTYGSIYGPYILLGGTLIFESSSFVAPLTPPADVEQPLVFTAPFSFHGDVAGFDYDSGELLFPAQSFTGQGTVTATTWYHSDFNSYNFTDVTYRFSPVPEPATLLLFGVGGTLLAGRRLIVSRPGSRRCRASIQRT